jgi:hypothetical protein
MTNPNTKKSAATAATAAQAESPIWSQVEQLSLKLGALEALLFNTSGASCESFNDMDEEQRDAYLSHCADMASAAKAEAKRITNAALALSQTARATA